MDFIAGWLRDKWKLDVQRDELLHAYNRVFNSVEGGMVMQDLLDKFLMVDGVPSGDAPRHLGRQDVVLAILRNVDMARNPKKYTF